MFKFLLQTVDDRIRHDFVFEMEHAIDYQNWRGNEMYAEYASIDDIINNNINIDADEIRDYIPIGTIEFVYTFIDKYIKENGSKEIKPLNVPEELFPFAKRQIENVYLNEDIRQLLYERIETEKNDIFIKSNDKIKSKFNSFYNKSTVILDASKLPDGNYQISQYIDIVSEYRCFVYNDKLVGIQYYSGEFDVFPKSETIYEMLKIFKYDYGNGTAPQAYTLDVGINDNGDTIPIECHEFFSCGLYGFCDYNVLPYMFVRTFNEIKKRLL